MIDDAFYIYECQCAEDFWYIRYLLLTGRFNDILWLEAEARQTQMKWDSFFSMVLVINCWIMLDNGCVCVCVLISHVAHPYKL